MRPKFPLGQILATPGALQALQAVGQEPLEFLQRHTSRDWAELCPQATKLWIITEADRSATTLLSPSEY